MKYTAEQAAQMERDTSFQTRTFSDDFGFVEERTYALVAAPAWGDSDPRFYFDFEWLDWMADAHPEYSVEDMGDAREPGLSWVVWVVTRLDEPTVELVVGDREGAFDRLVTESEARALDGNR